MDPLSIKTKKSKRILKLSKYNKRFPVDCKLLMKGKLTAPDITFGSAKSNSSNFYKEEYESLGELYSRYLGKFNKNEPTK